MSVPRRLLAPGVGRIFTHALAMTLACATAAVAQQLMDIRVSGATEETRAFTTRYKNAPGAPTAWQIVGHLVVVYRLTGPSDEITVEAKLLANTPPRLANGELQNLVLSTVYIVNTLDEAQGPPGQELKVSHTFPNDGIVKRAVFRVSAGPFPGVCGTSGGCSNVDVYVVVLVDPEPQVALLGGPTFPVVLGPPVPSFVQLSLFGLNPLTDVTDVSLDGSSLTRVPSGVVPLNKTPGANSWDRIPKDPLPAADLHYPGSDSDAPEPFLGCAGGGCGSPGLRIGMPAGFGPGVHTLRVAGGAYEAIIYTLYYEAAPYGLSGSAGLDLEADFVVIDANLQVSPPQAEAGSTITVTGTGFAPSNDIPLRLSVHCCGGLVPFGTVRSSSSGSFSAQVTLPAVNAPPFSSTWSSSAAPGSSATGSIFADVGDAAFVAQHGTRGGPKSASITFVKPGATPTTTTLPPRSCGGPADCDDGDACTDDACSVGVCSNTRRAGAAGVQCGLPVGGVRPPVCTNQSVPPRTEKQYGKATGLIDRAVRRAGGGARKLLKKADKALKRAERAVQVANLAGRLPDGCAEGIVDLIGDVRERIKSALDGS